MRSLRLFLLAAASIQLATAGQIVLDFSGKLDSADTLLKGMHIGDAVTGSITFGTHGADTDTFPGFGAYNTSGATLTATVDNKTYSLSVNLVETEYLASGWPYSYVEFLTPLNNGNIAVPAGKARTMGIQLTGAITMLSSEAFPVPANLDLSQLNRVPAADTSSLGITISDGTKSGGSDNNLSFTINTATFAGVPEPSSFSLLLAAFAVAGAHAIRPRFRWSLKRWMQTASNPRVGA
jgi:hypothetical protein